MKKRPSRAGERRNHERRFSERQVERGDDDQNLATREGRPVQLPLVDDPDGAVAEEIEGNALADGIGRLLDAIQPHLRAIGLAFGGLVLATVAWMWMNQQRGALEEQSWNAYLSAITSADDPAALASVVTGHPGSAAADWARLIQAEMALNEGTQLLFVDRNQATPKLQAAADAYGELLARRSKDLLAERATFGLAKANESLGRVEEARAGYDAVVSDYPDGVLVEPARQRAAALAGTGAAEWYRWFAAQRMTHPPAQPADGPILGLPGDGLPPGVGDANPPPQE